MILIVSTIKVVAEVRHFIHPLKLFSFAGKSFARLI